MNIDAIVKLKQDSLHAYSSYQCRSCPSTFHSAHSEPLATAFNLVVQPGIPTTWTKIQDSGISCQYKYK